MASSSPHQQQQPFLLLLPLLLLLLAPLFVPAAGAAAATSVYNLKPAQVDVVLALGDSITAGFGMEGKIGGLHEYRGKSWSIGGDANATTLPNFIRQHNPNVTGYSIGRREVRAGVCAGSGPPFWGARVDRVDALTKTHTHASAHRFTSLTPNPPTNHHYYYTHTQGSLCWGPLCRDVHRKKHDVLNGALSVRWAFVFVFLCFNTPIPLPQNMIAPSSTHTIHSTETPNTKKGAMIRNIHFDEFPYIIDVMSEMGIDVANSWKVRRDGDQTSNGVYMCEFT